MKLASLKHSKDGLLVVVSRNTKMAVKAGSIAKTLRDALDNWEQVAPQLESLYQQLNDGTLADAFTLDLEELDAPLPRTYQFLDGSAYDSHITRIWQAKGEKVPNHYYQRPLMYQGISYGFMAWNSPIEFATDDFGIDFEAEIAVITGDVPMGVSAEEAAKYIHLVVLMNDISLRNLVPADLETSFGFLNAKPTSTLAPFAVSPDTLGKLWDGKRLSGNTRCWARDVQFGNLESGIDNVFDFGHLIAHAAKTRHLEAGTVIGMGTVSNKDEAAGCACLIEIRTIEEIKEGEPRTPYLGFGDTVRIDHQDYDGNSIFGHIEQTVIQIR